jgi:hypothetical protein
LIEETSLHDIAAGTHAQALCEEFARRLGVPAPRIILGTADGNGMHCQSPTGTLAHLTEDGDIALAPVALSDWCLEFILAHHLAHLALNATEWECDLAALDLMRFPVMPIVAQTALTIAQIPALRARAFRFKSGARIIAIGDALANRVWEDSFHSLPSFRVSQSTLCPL